MTPKLSIIIPVYNAEKYLPKCLDSIVTQLTPEIEVILINDGSTDTSGSICDSYAQNHANILVIHIPNRGVANARNIGLTKATGDYIFFNDNDDWLNPTALRTILNLITTQAADIFIYQYAIVTNTGTRIGNRQIDPKEINQQSPEKVLSYLRTQRINIMAPWEYVTKRKLIVTHNLSFSPQQNGVDDSVFTPLLFCSAQSFYFNNTVVYNWRHRDDSQGKKHTADSYYLKMISTIESLELALEKFSANYQQEYIYFSIYKNLFSLFDTYNSYTPETHKQLRVYIADNTHLIKKAVHYSGIIHRAMNTLLGNFYGLRISYTLAVIKGKLK
jgi:glycosyltransferase EpsJ